MTFSVVVDAIAQTLLSKVQAPIGEVVTSGRVCTAEVTKQMLAFAQKGARERRRRPCRVDAKAAPVAVSISPTCKSTE